MDEDDVVEQIREGMELRGIKTERRLASLSGMSLRHIQKVMRGSSKPGPVTLKNVAEALGCHWVGETLKTGRVG
jgi:transcriptional regulator with XRE-family HTH domain